MKTVTVSSYPVSISIAGDHATAVQVCREYCAHVGLCVTVTPTDYVYKDGLEAGVVVGLCQYPRFPKSTGDIWATALDLGEVLRQRLCQSSFLVESPTDTAWVSARPDDKSPSER